MKTTTALFLAVLAIGGQAHAAKACEELKTEIATKLDGKGVKGYELTVVNNDKVGEAKVVGSCDGGAHKIVYSKK
jgi:predicted lipoprotein with Yx(FWY)xxD motif